MKFFYLSHKNSFATLRDYDKAMLRNIVVFFLVLTGIIKHGAEMAISGGGHFGIYLVWYNKVSITYIVNFAIDMLHTKFFCLNYTLFWYIQGVPIRVGPLIKETKCHLVSFGLLIN